MVDAADDDGDLRLVGRRFYRCETCGATALLPQLSRQELDDYYHGYWSQLRSGTPLMLRRDWRARLVAQPLAWWLDLRPRVKAVEKYCKRGRLLEVGCGAGGFLDAMRWRGWECHGLEMDREASRFCREVLGLAVEEGRLEDARFPTSSFDAIVLFHVFEHLSDPHGCLRLLRRWLKPGGILVLTVPNGDSWQRWVFGRSWYGYDVPRHYFVYGRKALLRLAGCQGYRVMEIGTIYGSYSSVLTTLSRIPVSSRWNVTRSQLLRLLSYPLLCVVSSPVFLLMDGVGQGEGLTCVLRRSEQEERTF